MPDHIIDLLATTAVTPLRIAVQIMTVIPKPHKLSLQEHGLNCQAPHLTGQHVWPGERMPQGSDAELAYQALDPTIIAIFKQALATGIKRYPAAFVHYSYKGKNDSKIPLDAAEAARRPVRKDSRN